MTSMTNMTRLSLLGLALVLMSGLGAMAEDKKLRELTVLLDWFPNADHVPIYAARQQGFPLTFSIEPE